MHHCQCVEHSGSPLYLQQHNHFYELWRTTFQYLSVSIRVQRRFRTDGYHGEDPIKKIAGRRKKYDASSKKTTFSSKKNETAVTRKCPISRQSFLE
jgi:hypothetical protein